MSQLMQLSPNFKLPAIDYAGQGNGILGIRDSGKSYTAMKAGEQMFEAAIPFIAFDPVGVWKNLKIGIGKHKGYPIVVAGGEGADIRLTPDNAVDIVRAAMKANISLVIDLYCRELINKSTWIKIVQEVVDLLMYENKDYGMRHIFLEEAAEFIPQRLQPQHARVYAAIERLARMGRNARLGLTIINQRAEEVNKAILEICAFSLLHKQVGKNSLKSIQTWLDLLQIDNVQEIIKSLPSLKQGECWAIGHDDHPKRIQVAARNTYHPDPKKGVEPTVKMLAVDVTGFVAKMNEQLKKPEIKKQATRKNATIGSEKNAAGVIGLRNQLAEKDQLVKYYQGLYTNAQRTVESISSITQKYFGAPVKEMPKTDTKVAIPPQKNYKSTPVVSRSAPVGSGAVTSGAMRMLKAAAMFHPNSITKTRMAALARLSYTSGSFGTYLSSLKRDGLITGEGNQFAITQTGLQQAGDVEPLPTDPKLLIELWCDVIGNSSGAARMLRVLGKTYPEDISKEDLGREVEMSHTSGSFGTYLSTLKRNGLIVVQNGWVKASEELFI